MAEISLVVPDTELAAMDAVVPSNRSAFMLAAVRASVQRINREREDRELARILDHSAEEDAELLAEFSGTVADGL